MDKLQLLLFFVGGFLLSRAMIVVRLPDKLVCQLLGRRSSSPTRSTILLTLLAAGFSFFIPNAVAVLTLLPVVARLTALGAGLSLKEQRSWATVAALAIIYGANIGGMGSITATPANGIFVAFIEAKGVAGRQSVHFVTWLRWGVPLVGVLTAVAVALLLAVFRPWRFELLARERVTDPGEPGRAEALVGWLTVGYFVASVSLSWAMLKAGRPQLVFFISAALTLLAVGVLFLVPVKSSDGKRPLLRIRECVDELPIRGLLLMGVAMLLAGMLYLLGAHRTLRAWLEGISLAGVHPRLLAFEVALITSFSTELLSNTAVQLVVLALLEPLAATSGLSMLKLGTIVTLSCTCAFMSPIATGVNGLAFGGVRGASLWRMLVVGFLMNLLAGWVVSVWVSWAAW